jgi:hypothetical protein
MDTAAPSAKFTSGLGNKTKHERAKTGFYTVKNWADGTGTLSGRLTWAGKMRNLTLEKSYSG